MTLSVNYRDGDIYRNQKSKANGGCNERCVEICGAGSQNQVGRSEICDRPQLCSAMRFHRDDDHEEAFPQDLRATVLSLRAVVPGGR